MKKKQSKKLVKTHKTQDHIQSYADYTLETKERTWRPAREDREVGFFLSLSFSLLRAAFFPIIKPLAPLPDIFSVEDDENGVWGCGIAE